MNSKPPHRIQIKTEIPGPKSRALREREDKNLAPGLQRFALMAGIAVERGQGSSVTDQDGNTFLDLIGGIGVNGLGHSHPKVVRAIQSQAEKISVGSFTSETRVELLEKIAEHRPSESLHRVQLYSSGAEAVESALRLAKSATGKHEVVSFWGGFHGKTLGVLSLMGSDFKNGLGPFAPGAHLAPYAYCYRCPLALEYPSCGIACAEMARKQIKADSSGQIAAILIEPMQGTNGNVIPPKEFLPAIQSIAKEVGALLIADEMITGFGRTGKYWGIQHTGVEPDIITLGKQFGGGLPVSAVLSRDEIVQSKPWSNPSGSSSSYGGNPLAAAAASAALSAIDEEKLVENSKTMGEYFLKKLRALLGDFPIIGEIRGVGLFIGIEFVKDRKTKEPLPKEATQRIFMECLKRGLLTMAYDAKFRIQPAMNIDAPAIDEACDVLEEVIREASSPHSR